MKREYIVHVVDQICVVLSSFSFFFFKYDLCCVHELFLIGRNINKTRRIYLYLGGIYINILL